MPPPAQLPLVLLLLLLSRPPSALLSLLLQWSAAMVAAEVGLVPSLLLLLPLPYEFISTPIMSAGWKIRTAGVSDEA
jgi:hypothetical protein